MVGWDGLGLISFCLVVFYSNHVRLDSGFVTVFSNRFGDVFFLCSFFFLGEGGFLLRNGGDFWVVGLFFFFFFGGFH